MAVTSKSNSIRFAGLSADSQSVVATVFQMPPHVLGVRDWLQVVGIYAQRISAKVVKFKPIRYWSLELCVDDSGRNCVSTLLRRFVPHAYLRPRSVVGLGPKPNPTSGKFIYFPLGTRRDMWAVTNKVFGRMAPYMSELPVRVPRNRRVFSASAHAQSAWVGRFDGHATGFVRPSAPRTTFLAPFVWALPAAPHHADIKRRAGQGHMALGANEFVIPFHSLSFRGSNYEKYTRKRVQK